jgi:hypothetical protein
MLLYFASCIFSVFKYGTLTFLLHTYLNAYHYDNYNSMLIMGTYKTIYVISNVQILYQRVYNRLDTLYKHILITNPSIAKYIIKDDTNKSYIEFIYDGYANYVTSTPDVVKNNFAVDADVPFDFILHSDYDSETKTTNKIIMDDFKNEFVYTKSNVTFILAEMIIEDKTIKVDFQTAEYNYFIENNTFSHAFLVYFMKQHYYNEIKDFKDKDQFVNMTLKIIDSNVTSETFDSKTLLLICKDNYKKISI